MPDGQYGVDIGNGTFSGVIGLVQQRKVMIAINGLQVSALRAAAADPLVPLGTFT